MPITILFENQAQHDAVMDSVNRAILQQQSALAAIARKRWRESEKAMAAGERQRVLQGLQALWSATTVTEGGVAL
jgi:hypothetical protein